MKKKDRRKILGQLAFLSLLIIVQYIYHVYQDRRWDERTSWVISTTKSENKSIASSAIFEPSAADNKSSENYPKYKISSKSNSHKVYSNKEHDSHLDRPTQQVSAHPESNDYKSSDATEESISDVMLDVNQPDSLSFIQAGMKPWIYTRMRKYQKAGGQISSTEDLKKIYGISEEMIVKNEQNFIFSEKASKSEIKKREQPTWQATSQDAKKIAEAEYALFTLDVNTLDSSAWRKLRGIGPAYAKRIVRYRSALGGFVVIEQVAETFGLPDSVYQSILPHLKLIRPHERIDLTVVTTERLARHPYISFKEAKVIISYLERHPDMQDATELKRCYGISRERLERMLPYFEIVESVEILAQSRLDKN